MNRFVNSARASISHIKDAVFRMVHPDHDLIKGISDILNSLKEDVSALSSMEQTNAGTSARIEKHLVELSSLIRRSNDSASSEAPLSASFDAEYVKKLQEDVVRMREDSYLKLMRKYILDTQIDLYQRIARRLYDLGQEEELRKILILQSENLRQIGVSSSSSAVGSVFDPGNMQVSIKKCKYTGDKSLDKTVACSIAPRFVWEVPVEGRGTRLLIIKEEVVLWEYTADEEKLHQEDIRNVQATSSPDASIRKDKADHGVQESGTAGYLVIRLDGDVSGVLPVNYGINIYGKNPKTTDNVYAHKINLLSEALKDEAFSIVISHDSDSVRYESIADNCSINRQSNYKKNYELENGDAVIIGNITFTFIEKADD